MRITGQPISAAVVRRRWLGGGWLGGAWLGGAWLGGAASDPGLTVVTQKRTVLPVIRVPRRTRPLPHRAALGLALALCLLWLAEVGLRIGGVASAYDPSRLAAWRMRANLSHDSIGAKGGAAHRVSTNADGLRSRVTRERRPGVARVALLGDSVVFGWGVDDGETLADGLEAALGAGVEVLNAGTPGYSSTQATWLFEEVVRHYRPDLVVFFIPLHDYSLVPVSDTELLRGGASAQAATRVFVARHSRIYAVLRQQLFAQTEEAFQMEASRTGEPRVPRTSDVERMIAVNRVQERLAAWGGRLVLGTLPTESELGGAPAPMSRSDNWVDAYIRRHPTVGRADVRRCCAGPGRVLPDDPGHLSPEGNLAVGAALAPIVAAALAP